MNDPLKEACKWAIPSIAICYVGFIIANPGTDGIVLGSVIGSIVTLVNVLIRGKAKKPTFEGLSEQFSKDEIAGLGKLLKDYHGKEEG